MLKEVFRTVPIPYMTQAEYDALDRGYLFGIHYEGNLSPVYVERAVEWTGLMVDGYSGLNSPESVYVWANCYTDYWPSWGSAFWRFDGKSGKLIARVPVENVTGNLGTVILGNKFTSRLGRLWAISYYGQCLIQLAIGGTATASVGELSDSSGYTWAGSAFDGQDDSGFAPGNIPATHFEGKSYYGSGVQGTPQIDDTPLGRFLDTQGADLYVYALESGKLAYTFTMPDTISNISLEDDDHVYILLGNRTLILFDYVRGEVLGAGKVPPLNSKKSYWNNFDVRMSWDPIYRRVLVIELVPDNADGSCACYVRGFRLVPEAVRLTTPIPLRVPRQGRVIPVLVQVVGDMNEGVAGYVLGGKNEGDPIEVSGSASLAGVPFSDYRGDTFISIACEGSPYFYGDYDWSTTGSPDATPPHAGLVTVAATARILEPVIPSSGVPGVEYGEPPPPPGTPDGGTDPVSGLTSEAPNMMGTMQQVYDRQVWNLLPEAEQSPNGRGAYTEAVVTALHDQDAKWGHIRKSGSQTQYHGHAVDAIMWQNPDGTTGEIFDILIGITSGDSRSALTWNFINRSADNLSLWTY